MSYFRILSLIPNELRNYFAGWPKGLLFPRPRKKKKSLLVKILFNPLDYLLLSKKVSFVGTPSPLKIVTVSESDDGLSRNIGNLKSEASIIIKRLWEHSLSSDLTIV